MSKKTDLIAQKLDSIVAIDDQIDAAKVAIRKLGDHRQELVEQVWAQMAKENIAWVSYNGNLFQVSARSEKPAVDQVDYEELS